MADQIYLLFKILILSALSSALIKYGIYYGLSYEMIAPSQMGALLAITLPVMFLAGLLWWRSHPSESIK